MRGERPINLQIYEIILNFLIVVSYTFFCQMLFVLKISMNLGEGRSRKSLIQKLKTSLGVYISISSNLVTLNLDMSFQPNNSNY